MAHSTAPRHRLYVASPLAPGASLSLPDDQAHYLLNVLRLEDGAALTLFNGQDGEWLGRLRRFGKKNAAAEMVSLLRGQQAGPDLWLVSAPLRQHRSDMVVEKATELGASRIVPVRTQYTGVDRVNESRWQGIAREAAEQCERLDVPAIDPLTPLLSLLGGWPAGRMLLYGDESGQSPAAQEAIAALPPGPLAVLVGPEGGFANMELELLRSLPFAAGFCMGPRILRADTAAIAALALIQSQRGDWEHKPAFRNEESR